MTKEEKLKRDAQVVANLLMDIDWWGLPGCPDFWALVYGTLMNYADDKPKSDFIQRLEKLRETEP